jgi:hypothetical protein
MLGQHASRRQGRIVERLQLRVQVSAPAKAGKSVSHFERSSTMSVGNARVGHPGERRDAGSDGRGDGDVGGVEVAHTRKTIAQPICTSAILVWIILLVIGHVTRVALLAAALLALAPAADAATRTKLDRDDEVRFQLDGRDLTLTIVDGWRYGQIPSTKSRLFGKPVVVACGTSFQFSRKTAVIRRLRWPVGASSLSVRFARDVSRNLRWCLIDEGPKGGADIAFVSFVRAEPGRRLTAGRLSNGKSWRLVVWRGDHLQPCVSLRVAREDSGYCFDEQAEREATVEATFDVPTCSDEAFVIGVASRSAAAVIVRMSDGSGVPATLHRRPRNSRVRAQYFIAPFTRPLEVVAVEARDAENRVLARDRRVGGGGVVCERVRPRPPGA